MKVRRIALIVLPDWDVHVLIDVERTDAGEATPAIGDIQGLIVIGGMNRVTFTGEPGQPYVIEYTDDLTNDPKPEVARLMTALDLPVDDAFLDACAKLVFPDARRRRDEIDWPAGVEDAICKRLAQYDFMQRYAEAHASAPTSA